MKNHQEIESCLLSGTFLYEEPLTISKKSARVFGIECAAIAQQFVYWTLSGKCSLKGEILDGRKWVYFSSVELGNEFNWASERTVRRRVEELVKCGFLTCRKSSDPKDMRNRYTVNHGTVAAIESGKLNHLNENGNLSFRCPIDGADDGVGQIGQVGNEGVRLGQIGQGGMARLAKSHIEPISQSDSSIMSGSPDETGLQGANRDSKATGNLTNLEASPSAEPTPQTPMLRRTPFPQGQSEAPKPPKVTTRQRNPLFDALALACGLSVEHMTKSEGGRVGKALSDIRAVKPDLTTEDISVAAQNFKKLMPWCSMTPTAISAHWSQVRPGAVITEKASKQERPAWQIRRDLESQLATLEEDYLRHPANSNSRRFDPDAYESVKAEGAAKKAQIKAIKQQLAQLPQQQP